MGRQFGQASLQIRELIIKHYKDGLSMRTIAQLVKRTHSTVRGVINQFKTRHTMKNKSKPIKRKIFTKSEERWIVRQVKKNPKISALKLALAAKIQFGQEANPETILRKHNLHGRLARKSRS